MDIATGAMNTLLPKLGKLLVEEYKLQNNGVKGEIKELEKELEGMNAALNKVSKVPADELDEQAKLWARDVRELSYDIEDAIDTFVMHGKEHESTKAFKLKGLVDRTVNLYKKAKSNHRIHSVIKDIMDEVKKVRERRDRYKVDDVASRMSTVTIDPRIEAMYRKATELVGIDGPKNELVKRLMLYEGSSSRQQIQIISIVGFAGLGKTTLANTLLHDLKAKFDCHAFVSVSLDPDIKMILKNILSQLDEYAYLNEAFDVVQLIDKIIKFLENKRFLCVIDDVWNESAWDTIKLALQSSGDGSKIVITTRNKAVAEYAGGGIYELKPLSEDDSRKLLNKRIFDTDDGCLPSLREVTGKILKKCGGVPLAIITTASLLARKPLHPAEWEKMNNSIDSGLEKSPDVDKMKKILSLSYNDLPSHLKTCLLSLSKYPEDEKIRKDVLVWSWIAEDFITEDTKNSGTSLQETGESYFNELINRSWIQPVDIHHFTHQDGQVHAFQVHDVVLELINQLSAEEGFVTTLLSDGQQVGRTPTARKNKIRRLSLHNSNKSYASPGEAREALSKVRSLTVFGKVDSIPPLSSFLVLRVLQLQDCTYLNINHISGLGELRHLRFLQLRQYNNFELPESIGRLESLETLDIRAAPSVVMLPMSFVKLRKLVRLLADKVLVPRGAALRDMKSLQELVGIYFTQDMTQEIGNLNELRVLKIFVGTDMVAYDISNVTASIIMCLQRCTNLLELEIQTYSFAPFTLDNTQQVPSGLQRFSCRSLCMKDFPRWMNSSTFACLTSLSTEMYQDPLLPDHLEKLAELPSLRFLRLHVFGVSKLQKLSIPGGACSFRCLRDFHFYSFSKFITFQPGAMFQLQRLCFWFRSALMTNELNDFGLENLRSLRNVTIKCIIAHKYQEETEFAIRDALKSNPNHPSLELLLSYC